MFINTLVWGGGVENIKGIKKYSTEKRGIKKNVHASRAFIKTNFVVSPSFHHILYLHCKFCDMLCAHLLNLKKNYTSSFNRKNA